MQIPYGGYFVEAQNNFATKVDRPTIVFVHHWGGSRSSSRPHMNFVSKHGFRSFTFSQSFHSRRTIRIRTEIFPKVLLGLRHIWADEIGQVLDLIEGEKILYSFSFPSGSTLEAIARREAKDVKAWICDGGPFLDLHQCYRNYFTYQTPIRNSTLREAAVLGGYFFFGIWNIKKDFEWALSKLPQGFPILSIRGLKDPLVSPEAINEVFDLKSRVDLQVLTLSEGKHIDGFKNCSEVYRSVLTDFLARF